MDAMDQTRGKQIDERIHECMDRHINAQAKEHNNKVVWKGNQLDKRKNSQLAEHRSNDYSPEQRPSK